MSHFKCSPEVAYAAMHVNDAKDISMTWLGSGSGGYTALNMSKSPEKRRPEVNKRSAAM